MKLAEQLISGTISVDQFVHQAGLTGIADLGEVNLDLGRHRRCGFPEVVFGQGKSTESLIKIFHKLVSEEMPVLATRIQPQQAGALAEAFPDGAYNEVARTFRLAVPGSPHPSGEMGSVSVVTAGTSDLAVAEEARETLDWMDVGVTMIHDVGVAGPHRLPAQLDKLTGRDAIIVVAGMEGALPSVVGGYVDCPVIAVPTSIGYGASFSGVAALLGMLNSCAANVSVVNIDAGFKGGYVAGLIARGKHVQEPSAQADKTGVGRPQG